MGIQYFEDWVAESRLLREDSLSSLGRPENGPVIGVDGTYFLDRFRHPSKEPLVPALGGFPMAIEALISKHIQEIQSFGCRLWFYFDGLDCAFENTSFTTSIATAKTVADAFTIYETGDATKAIDKFRQAEYPDMATLTASTKVALHKLGVPFSVAPFKAHAQMIYNLEQGVIDGLYGSSELFLYGAEKVIARLSLHHQPPHGNEEVNGNVKKEPEFVPEKSTFSFIERDACLKALGDLSPDAFIDALLAIGSSYLATFPPILGQQPISFRHVVDLLGNCQYDIHRLCSLYPHDEHLSHSNWEDRFIRAHVAIHHMPILIGYDTVKPRSALDQARFGRIPNSLHDIVGLTLPEELLFYLFQGMIGPRVLNWLISGKVMVFAPLAGGDTPVYRTLVKTQLAEWRRQALGILASSINRYFQIRDVKTSYWFGESGGSFNMKNATSSLPILSTWRVKKDVLEEEAKKHPPHKAAGIGWLSFSVRALTNTDFAAKTICEKPATFNPLVDSDEIVANAIWRGLHLRGFVDDTHQLTKWGQVLATVIETLGNDASREQVEAAFVSVELLRLGLLNGDEMFPSPPNTASKGSESDKPYVALLSRIAATGRMRHPVRGYSGPLNRQVLSYHCIISEVRSALRDLFEMALAVLFLESSAKRIRDNYTQIAKLLPFQENHSAGLGVIAKTYFDELASSEKPLERKTQETILTKAEGWFAHIDVANSFKDACQLWKALFKGAEKAADQALLRDDKKAVWSEAEKWMGERVAGNHA